jgi:predicted TIM-barrel fold metal-dependent hydrolase
VIIDAHVNITRDGKWHQTSYDASLDRALREMDAADVAKAVVIPTAGQDNRDFTVELAASHADRFVTGVTINRLDHRELDEVRALLSNSGCRFIKIHPRSTGIIPSDNNLDPFLALAQEFNVPVLFCTYMRGPRLAMKDLTPLVFDEIARRRPNLTIVLCHAGSYRPLDALAVAQSHANVYLDMSHVLEYFRGSSAELDFIFMLRRLDRKVIYGSDFPEYSIAEYLKRAKMLIENSGVSSGELFFAASAEKIYNIRYSQKGANK